MARCAGRLWRRPRTGYRRKEIGSLTKRSFRLDSDPPTVTVAAAYSKRRRQDAQVLHPEVVSRIRRWLDRKRDLGSDDLLFPISGYVPGGQTTENIQNDEAGPGASPQDVDRGG